MDDRQRSALLGLVSVPGRSGPVDEAKRDVLEAFGVTDGVQLGLDLLGRGVGAQDGEMTEYALLVAFCFGYDDRLRPLVHQLVRATWHSRHEDVSELVEELGGPDAVTDLSFLAWADERYLAYPGDTALARKAAHSLERIATLDAQAAIDALLTHPEAALRELAGRMVARRGRRRRES